MSSKDALREFAKGIMKSHETWGKPLNDEWREEGIEEIMERTTALISEHYYPKEFVEWLFGHSLVWDEKTMTWFTQIERVFDYWKENER